MIQIYHKQKQLDFLLEFKFDKLKILNLNGNNLNSLSFVDYLEYSNLEVIRLNNNSFTEFISLNKY